MTRSELIDTVVRRLQIERPLAERVVNVLFDGIRDALLENARVEIRGFGTFRARHYAAYVGRNPRTGVEIHVKAKVLPVFKVGKELRARVNGGVDEG